MHTQLTGVQEESNYYLKVSANHVSNWGSKRGNFRPERCRLTDSVFEKLMNIKCNGHLV